MIQAILFLGNPGRDYDGTRHNIGIMVAKQLANKHAFSWSDKWNSSLASPVIHSTKLHLLLPGTYMNRSGEPARALCDFFKISPSNLLVLHDDLETPFGSIRLRLGGGAAGHNGLRSLDTQLGTKDYYRLKIGIGRPVRGDVSSFVLSRFSSDEEIVLPLILDSAVSILEKLIGIDDASLQKMLKSCNNIQAVQM